MNNLVTRRKRLECCTHHAAPAAKPGGRKAPGAQLRPLWGSGPFLIRGVGFASASVAGGTAPPRTPRDAYT